MRVRENGSGTKKKGCLYGCAILMVALPLIFVACLLIERAVLNRPPPEDIYAGYQVYDYHLSVSEKAVGKEYGQYLRYVCREHENADDVFLEYEVTYRLIKGMDSEESIYADVRWNVLLSTGQPYVMQNPETNDVDLFSDWTVSSIVIQCDEKNKAPSVFVADPTVYDELLALREGRTYEPFYSMVDVPDELHSYILSTALKAKMESYFPDTHLRIQVFFEESDAIYWETRIGFSAGLLYVDVGKALVEFDEERKVAPIREDSALCRAIIAALEAYAAQ